MPEDIPAEPRANAAWYEVMKVPGVTVAAAGLGQPELHRLAFAAFASRHAGALRAVPAGLTRQAWLGELSALLRDAGRAPSRATDPRAVLAAVDLAALRRRAAPFAGRFVHPADEPGRPRRVDPGPGAGEEAPPPPPTEPQLCRRSFADWTRERTEVRQLTTLRELRQEGARQRNCVASYDELVEAGSALVFSVLVEARPLTLSLVRRDGCLRVSEFKGFANRRASPAEWAALDHWLRHAGASR